MKMNPIWIVKGMTVDDDGHETGAVEWQFSDGPAGNRGYSEDYSTLEEGLRDHSGSVFYWTEDSE